MAIRAKGLISHYKETDIGIAYKKHKYINTLAITNRKLEEKTKYLKYVTVITILIKFCKYDFKNV